MSLDAPVSTISEDSGPEPLGNTLGAEDERLALVETTALLPCALREVPHLEREALRLRVQEDLKQSEIAVRLGCSQMQVSRLLRRAAQRVHASIEQNLNSKDHRRTSVSAYGSVSAHSRSKA